MSFRRHHRNQGESVSNAEHTPQSTVAETGLFASLRLLAPFALAIAALLALAALAAAALASLTFGYPIGALG